MSFFDEIRERVRRTAYLGDDSWYVTENQYILELRTRFLAPGVPLGLAFMVLPLGPENYTVSREFRQSVTPTVGGLIAEERGLLWRNLTVNGTFGLKSRTSPEFSVEPEGHVGKPALLGLSGPGWTRRMIRNFFEQYGKLKANPEYAADTFLIWHDNKTDDHWVVVPEMVNVARTTQRRFQYPYELRMKAVADADAFPTIPTPSSLLGKIKNAIGAVNAALQDVSSAIQEGSRILGEVRYFVATIDSIVDKLTIITQSAQDFVDGVTDTLSIGEAFIKSTTRLLDEALQLMEQTAELPNAVRQNYQMAADGLDSMLAEARDAFAKKYSDVTDSIADDEAGAAGDSADSLTAAASAGPAGSAQELASQRARSSDQARVDAGATSTGRPFNSYTGTRVHVVAATDTLPSLAARFLGDGSLWFDLALLNGLKAPYVSDTGAPGTVAPGSPIVIPTFGPSDQPGVASDEGETKGVDLLGTDFALIELPNSVPGAARVDIAVDRRHKRDAKLIQGVPNLSQALQLRVWTERGTMPLLPYYGLPQAIGVKNDASYLALLKTAFRETMRADPRVARIADLTLKIDGDVTDANADIIPVGYDSAQALSVAIG